MRALFTFLTLVGVGLAVSFAQFSAASVAEIKIFTSRAVATVIEQVGPQFESVTGNKLNGVVDLTIALVNRVRAGETVDIVVALPELIDSLIKDGRIIGETRTNLVRSGLGVEVQAGAPKPDVTSVDAFKQTLLQAKTVGYLNTPAGTHLDAILNRLGIAEVMKQKNHTPEY